jgi:hypothetical protein
MRGLACAVLLGLVAAVPAVGRAKQLPPQPIAPPPPPGFPGGPIAPGGIGQPGGAVPNYVAPKADGPVVELLDEGLDPLFPQLMNDGGGEPGTVTREDRDVFAGVEAARVTPMQKYRSMLPGWNFKIVEKPTKAGEFRYLRFAWKKSGGGGIMIQFHDPARSWAFRYFAGRNVQGWQPAMSVSDKLPGEWEVVTRDLFKDWGAITLTGFALTPFDGTGGLFDHMLLGRTVEDLDKATAAALGKVKPEKALAGKERDAAWADLVGSDRVKAAAAQRQFLSTATDHTDYIGKKLAVSQKDKELGERIQRLVADLDNDKFDVRDAATDALVKIGAPAVEAVRVVAANGDNDELRYRGRLILKKLGADGTPVSTAGKTARVVRVLERAGTKDARDLLTKMAAGEFGFDGAADAKAALARMPKSP